MKKSSSTFVNPQIEDLYFYGFSKELRKKSPNQKLKRSVSQLDKSSSKSDLSLPLINFHVPSYEIVNNARMKKKESILSTSKLPDRQLIDFTMKNMLSRNQKYDAISSKVDFFSTRNQKRLNLHKRKVFVDLGMIKVEKPPVFINRNNVGSSPQIFKLLQKYVSSKQRSESKENSFIVVGKDFETARPQNQVDPLIYI